MLQPVSFLAMDWINLFKKWYVFDNNDWNHINVWKQMKKEIN